MAEEDPQSDQRPPMPPLVVPLVTGATPEDVERLRVLSEAGRRVVEQLKQEETPPHDAEG